MTDEPLHGGISIGKVLLKDQDFIPNIVFGSNPEEPTKLLILLRDPQGEVVKWSTVPLEQALFHVVNLIQNLDQLFFDCNKSTVH